jgi:hypothetical protein
MKSQSFSTHKKLWSLQRICALSFWEVNESEFFKIRVYLAGHYTLLAHQEGIFAYLVKLIYSIAFIEHLEADLLVPDALGTLCINEQESFLPESMFNLWQHPIEFPIKRSLSGVLSLTISRRLLCVYLFSIFVGMCNDIGGDERCGLRCQPKLDRI